jgi:23S rRNA G2445 N2-methylase RlmL
MKKRIEETAEKAFAKFQKDLGKKADPLKKLNLYVRFNDNHCTLSLDTSGERLHKRGIRTHIGEAPLRETIAAALIQMMGRHADKKTPIEFIDPMMGSGTFLLEAAYRDLVLEKRDFAFENFSKQPEDAPVIKTERAPIDSLLGFEKDPKTLSAAKKNLADTGSSLNPSLHLKDFFLAEPIANNKDKQRWVVANPPYGERIKVDEPLGEFYAKLFAVTERVSKPDLACFLLPSKAASGRLLLPVTRRVLEKRPFSNGGIPVLAFVFGRK